MLIFAMSCDDFACFAARGAQHGDAQVGAERRVRQGEADLLVHHHQRPENLHLHLREDGLPGSRRQDCRHGDRLAGGVGRP